MAKNYVQRRPSTGTESVMMHIWGPEFRSHHHPSKTPGVIAPAAGLKWEEQMWGSLGRQHRQNMKPHVSQKDEVKWLVQETSAIDFCLPYPHASVIHHLPPITDCSLTTLNCLLILYLRFSSGGSGWGCRYNCSPFIPLSPWISP